MVLVVENGNGVPGADAYVTVEEVDTYAEKFGKDGWLAIAPTVKAVKIREASRFIDNKFHFPGMPKTADQGLFFPVNELYVRGHAVQGIPRQLKDATCELAVIASTINLTEDATARSYTYRKVKAADFEKTERFSTDNADKTFHTVEMLLAPLMSATTLGKGFKTFGLMRG